MIDDNVKKIFIRYEPFTHPAAKGGGVAVDTVVVVDAVFARFTVSAKRHLSREYGDEAQKSFHRTELKFAKLKRTGGSLSSLLNLLEKHKFSRVLPTKQEIEL